MAGEHTPAESAPPAGEQVHLPRPSLVPVLNAAGATLVLLGLTTTVIFSIAGGALFLATLVRWIRDSRRELASLPLEH